MEKINLRDSGTQNISLNPLTFLTHIITPKRKMKKRDKRIILGVIGVVGIGIIIYQSLKIKNLERSLYVCQGEKLNLETINKGYRKTLENLTYQLGKLASKKIRD